MAHFDRAGPCQQLEIACQASSSQPRLTAASLNPRQPSTSTHVNPSTSTVTLNPVVQQLKMVGSWADGGCTLLAWLHWTLVCSWTLHSVDAATSLLVARAGHCLTLKGAVLALSPAYSADHNSYSTWAETTPIDSLWCQDSSVFCFRAGSRIRGISGGLGTPLSGFWPGGRQQRFLGCTSWDAHAVPVSTETQQVSKNQ
jgi:hypothetical protein